MKSLRRRQLLRNSILLAAASVGCEDGRDRPFGLPNRPHAQSDAIPDRLQFQAGRAPLYRVVLVDSEAVHLVPVDPGPEQTEPREQGDPFYEFVILKSRYEDMAGTPAVAGAVVELEIGLNGQPEDLIPVESPPRSDP